MTVLNENAISTYVGDNSATTFDFDFLINAEDELTVIRTADDGTQTTLTLNTDYSINETGNDNGSFITFPLDSSTYGLLQSDENISIFPNLAFTQETAYKNSSALNLENIENSFDYQCRLLQQLKVDTDRAIKLPHGSSMTADELLEEYQEAAAEIASSNSRLTAVETQVDNLKIVNVQDYFVAPDADWTNAFRRAIFAVSPITTDFTGLTLADYTIGTAFSASDVYRYGGKVIAPHMDDENYVISDTIYLNPYVQIVGDGKIGIGQWTIETSKGTVIDFQPADVTNKIAFVNCGFDKTTGQRWDYANNIFTSTDNNNISANYHSKLVNVTVNCKSGCLAGIYEARNTGGGLENVSVTGEPIVGLIGTSAWSGGWHNIVIHATTIGILKLGHTVWAHSGVCEIDGTGTKTTLPYWINVAGTNEDDQFPAYSTGLYSSYGGQATFDSLTIQHWDRGIVANNCNWVLNTPYFEDIEKIVINSINTNLVVNSPLINCPNATVLYAQLAGSTGKTISRNIKFTGDFSRYSTYNKLLDAPLGSFADGIIFDIEPATILTANDLTSYSSVAFPYLTERAETINIYIDSKDGVDTQWGYFENAPVKLEQVAYALVKPNKSNIINYKIGRKYAPTSGTYATIDGANTTFQSYGTQLTGITGTITNGTPNLVVNDASGFAVDDYISLAGTLFNTLYPFAKVTVIDGNNVTLDTNAVSDVTNGALTLSNPILEQYNASGYGRYRTLKNGRFVFQNCVLNADASISQANTKGQFNCGGMTDIICESTCYIIVPAATLGLIQGDASTSKCAQIRVNFKSPTIKGSGYISVSTTGSTVITETASTGTTIDATILGHNHSATLKVLASKLFTNSVKSTWNPASIANGAALSSSPITVAGAAIGDAVLVFPPYDLQGLGCDGYVNSANSVIIRLTNLTGGAVDLASGSWGIKAVKYFGAEE